MGVLYLAVDPALKRPVALKLLRFHADEIHRRFKREASAAARLDHRNIVTIFDIGDHEGQPFIAMEYIDGETLAELIDRRAPLPVAERVRLIADLCDGLAWAHKSGIVHRDVKPANVMVTADGVLKIIDFGIARLVDSRMTQTRGILGTPHYISPEQLEGRPADQLSDMFCVGLVMYELLSLQRPFPGQVPHVVATHILSAEPRPLNQLVPGIDPDLVTIVNRALQKRPPDRYSNVSAMRADLMRVLSRLQSASPVIGQFHVRVSSRSEHSVRASHSLLRLRPAAAAATISLSMVGAITMVATLWRQPPVAPAISSAPKNVAPARASSSVADALTPVLGAVPDPNVAIAGAKPASTARPLQPAADGEIAVGGDDRIAGLIKDADSSRLRREYDAAIATYLHVLDLAPQNELARAGLTETRAVKQQAEAALERLAAPSLEDSIDRSSAETDARRLVDAALEALNAGDDAAAQKALEDALRADPSIERAQKLLKVLTGR
jgi:serine/threonine protein kinase